MAEYTKRVQAVLSQEQYEALLEISESLDKPISVLIREAIEEVYLTEAERIKRRETLKTLLSLEAPVTDWEQMESEIVSGASE
ncbi:MAG: hypothetical protein PVH03_05310 [Chloroflexota bacterium]|jgi:predicted DNA-binding protein